MQSTAAVSLDDKWTVTRGRIFLNGTQALARVLLAQAWLDKRDGLDTAGYVSGYRGSPLGNVDTTLWSIGKRLDATGIRFQPGVNEDLAATAIAGTQQIDQLPGARHDGVFAAWYGKGPGVDRAGDAFKHGHYAGAHAKGGVVLFYGDDHAGKSSTVAHQSEQAIAANVIPSFYPAHAGEILEYGLLALALSRHSGMWTAVKCVNEVTEQTASVDIDLDAFAPVRPPVTSVPPEGLHAGKRAFNPLRAEQIVLDYRLPLVIPFVRANRIDRTVFRAPTPRLAIASAGKSHGDVMQALALLGLDAARAAALGVSLYKIGCIWPLDGESLAGFARGHDTLLIVEEKKSFIEAQAAAALVNNRTAPRLIGKADEDGAPLLSPVLPLEPADIALVIAERLARLGLADAPLEAATARLAPPPAAAQGNAAAPRRSPFFCSGCPHNRSTRLPDGSLSMTGIGCHTMAHFVAPDRALLPTQMGAEGTNWMGLAPFTNTSHIFQNMGDGTYYHSGLLAIRAAVASGVNITYKILYNDAVAMTGGQPVDGPLSVAEIAQQVRHEGVERIAVLSDNPDHHRRETGFPSGVTIAHRDELDRVQRELREFKGCSVLIYEQTCAAEKRRRRKRGTFPDPARRMFIAEEVCEGCGDCSVQSSCVSIVPKETALGRKRAIDQSSCNKDYSCAEGFCPSFITVRDAEPRKPKGANVDDGLFAALPEPVIADAACNIMVAGIGGTGVITVGALIGMAAHLDGRAASLFDMTGLAQKNGAVFSHIRIAASPGDIHAQKLGRGEADVLLAFDLIAALSPEAASTIAQGRTRAIANSAVLPTVAFQFDRDAVPEPEILLGRLAATIGRDRLTTMDAAALALGLTGDTIAANLMVVGMASQLGLLPVTPAALEQAIGLNGVAVKLNLTAFRLGRLFIADPDRVESLIRKPAAQPLPQTLDEIIAHRSAHLTGYQGTALAERYRESVAAAQAAEQRVAPGSDALALVVARNLAKLMAIKDEYEVARLLTDPALHARIAGTFEDGARLSFNMAPPFLPGRSPNGRPRKREFPKWLVFPALRLLAAVRGVRGTALDAFGWTAERRAERALLHDYEALVDRTLARLTADNLPQAIALLDEVAAVRGFGPVKLAAMDAYRDKIAAAEARMAERAAQQPEMAAG
ncbi:indolepyruvate ferredoxin oxidoreductase [Sphingomonas sp. Root710]|uniref:indolepyruvate ferredoxin oxidoreductase family protein n=1 Tax=Sphingomonas sp. Root710 TaxID=1736594 RepID=UPI0006F4F2E9|nr:indolepyruvate ferredoxin oxidoreductase family protein [Sphingomonas sp. Root710]KRB80591.1 indolepyruvate ferredoxin oxidoreductase [Sphingomonas sp. Root710]